MPHRTVFQIGKDHAHPFTNFVGGVVVGALITAGISWYYILQNYTDDQTQTASPVRKAAPAVTGSPAVTLTPSPSPAVSF